MSEETKNIAPATNGPPSAAKQRVSRRAFLGVAALSSVALLAGCGAPESKPEGAPKPAGGESPKATSAPAVVGGGPIKGGSLRIGTFNNPTSLDPSPSNGELFVLRALYDSLLTFDEQLNPKPGLAESWETPDDKTMVLHLRKGVKFHDGTDFDADAVKTNIEYTKDPATRTLFTADFEPIDAVEVVDKNTVRLKLKGVAAPLLASFGMQPGHMISPAALKKYGKDAGRNPVGTGPFIFQEWVEQDHITMKRNPDYWDRDSIYLDEITFRIVPDTSVRLANLKAGELDYVIQLLFKDVAATRSNQDFQLYRTWAGADRFILNNSKPPFDKKPLRQALQLALDREGMHKSIFFESGTVAYGPIHPPGSWAFDASWKPFERDLDKARAKLKEGGAPDGFAFHILASDTVNLQIAEAYQAMYAPLGIKMTVDKVDSAKRIADQQSLNYEASLSTWQTTLDPSPALYTPYHSKGSGNYLKYSNPRVDELLEKAISVYDRAQRRTYYREVDQILSDDAPCIIPYHRARFDATTSKVQGVKAKADPQLEVRGLWLSK